MAKRFVCNGVVFTTLKECIRFKLLNEDYGNTTTDINMIELWGLKMKLNAEEQRFLRMAINSFWVDIQNKVVDVDLSLFELIALIKKLGL